MTATQRGASAATLDRQLLHHQRALGILERALQHSLAPSERQEAALLRHHRRINALRRERHHLAQAQVATARRGG